jgi:hypothetical protein
MNAFAIAFGVASALLICTAVNVYIGRRLYQGLKRVAPRLKGRAFGWTYGAVAAAFLLSYLPLPEAVRWPALEFGGWWMGIWCYLLMGFVAADFLLAIGRLARLIPSPVPPSVRFGAWLIAVLLTAGFAGYGGWHATQIQEVRYEVKLDDAEAGAPPLRIALISDLHLGAARSESRLEEIVARINRMEPDLVVMAGDIFNDDFTAIRNPERASGLLRQLEARYGVYASLGNHDAGRTLPEMLEFLEDSGVTVLMEEHVVIDGRFVLIGRLDPSPIGGYGDRVRMPTDELLAGMEVVDPALPRIVLDHTPSRLGQYGDKVDLILSGHTHRGQIFPANLVTRLLYEVDYGYLKKGPAGPHVIVTSGVGTWGMPMRVATDCEIVEIVLTF